MVMIVTQIINFSSVELFSVVVQQTQDTQTKRSKTIPLCMYLLRSAQLARIALRRLYGGAENARLENARTDWLWKAYQA